MSLIVAVLILTLAAASLTKVLRVRFELAMPVATMGIGVTLYAAYILGILHTGLWAIVAAVAIGAVWLLIDAFRTKRLRDIARSLTSPQLVTFLVVCIVCFSLTHTATVGLWDELRLWGAYPKILHFTGALQMGPQADLFIYMQSYLPGMPLLAYFFTAFSSTFSEPTIFFAYSVVASVFVLPATRILTWRRAYLIPVFVGLSIAVPLYFWNSFNDSGDYFGSLYIDTYLGLIAGFGTYLLAIGSAHARAGRVALALTAVTLFLFKESGLSFAVILLAVALIQTGRRGWTSNLSARVAIKKFIVSACTLAAPLLVTFISWKWILGANGLSGWGNSNYLAIHHTISGASRFLGALFTRGIMRADIPFVGGRSYLLIALLLAVVIAATWLWMSKIRAVRPLITGGPGRTALMVAFAGLGYAGSGFVVFAFGHYQGLPISYALVATIMGVAVLGIWLRLRVEDKSPSSRRNFVAGLVSACAMNFVFVVGLYFLTAGPFGGELFSFERYMSTPCVLGLTFLVLYVATQHWGQTRTVRGSAATLVVALALSTLALLFPLRAPLAFDGGWNTQAATESALLVQAAEKSPPIRTEGRDPGVFLVFAGPPIEDAGLHHRIYFNMIGSGFEVRNYYTETEIAAATNRAASTYQADAAKARRNFEDQLRSDTYDFVYVVETDSELSSQFHAIFPGGPAEHALYRVDRSGSEPVLTRAN